MTCATWYYHTIYLVFTYFASFTDYEDDIFEGISNLHVQGPKFGGKIYKFCGKFKKKLNSTEFMEFVFSKSELLVTIVWSTHIKQGKHKPLLYATYLPGLYYTLICTYKVLQI